MIYKLYVEVCGILSGRNGLDLNIGIKYDSSLSNMYKEIYSTGYYMSYYAVYAERVSILIEVDDYGKENILEADVGENKLIGNYNTMQEAEDAFNYYDELYSGIFLIPGRDNQFYRITYNGTIEEYHETYSYNDILPDTYEEVHNNFGTGWSLSFSSIEIDNGNQYLHLSDGRVYKYVPTSITDDSNLDKYTLKDIKLEVDKGSYSNGQKISSYVLIYKNGNKEYFADDGRLLAIQDKYDNIIKFEHIMIKNHPVISKITDSLGRIINLVYKTTSTGKEVDIITPNNLTMKMWMS